MIIISGGQVGVEGVAARAVFEANQSGISEKKLSVPQEARQRSYALSRAQEYCTRNQLKNMITLKSVDPEIIKISTKQTYRSVLENIDFQDTSRSEPFARSEPIYTPLDLNWFT